MRIQELNAPAAKNISKIIKSKGLKQTFVVGQSGYSTQELSDMLNGRKLIKACDIAKLADVLGTYQ